MGPHTAESETDRWLQAVESHQPPERVEFTIAQPRAAEIYYSTCGKIDQHNRRRHDSLMLERKIETVDWSKRVNLSIFGMIVVDSYLVYSQVQDSSEPEKEFYTYLAEELIDNTYDQVARRPRSSNIASPEMMGRDGMPRSGGLFGHLTPTKRKRRDRNNQLQQGRCCLCHKKTSSVCSSCRDESQKEVWCCHSKTGRDCFAQHYSSIHNS
jgi:hypothetical protein